MGEWVVPEKKQIQEEAAGAAAAFIYLFTFSGMGQTRAAHDIIFRGYFPNRWLEKGFMLLFGYEDV